MNNKIAKLITLLIFFLTVCISQPIFSSEAGEHSASKERCHFIQYTLKQEHISFPHLTKLIISKCNKEDDITKFLLMPISDPSAFVKLIKEEFQQLDEKEKLSTATDILKFLKMFCYFHNAIVESAITHNNPTTALVSHLLLLQHGVSHFLKENIRFCHINTNYMIETLSIIQNNLNIDAEKCDEEECFLHTTFTENICSKIDECIKLLESDKDTLSSEKTTHIAQHCISSLVESVDVPSIVSLANIEDFLYCFRSSMLFIAYSRPLLNNLNIVLPHIHNPIPKATLLFDIVESFLKDYKLIKVCHLTNLKID